MRDNSYGWEPVEGSEYLMRDTTPHIKGSTWEDIPDATVKFVVTGIVKGHISLFVNTNAETVCWLRAYITGPDKIFLKEDLGHTDGGGSASIRYDFWFEDFDDGEMITVRLQWRVNEGGNASSSQRPHIFVKQYKR